jgi:phosphoribosylformylglycinamidine synthase
MEDLQQFLSYGKYILGVCNGFQALVKMGLLPNVSGDFEQEATLTHNDSGTFEDRWVRMRVNKNARTPYLTGLEEFDVPVRHGEGKLIFRDDAIRQAVLEQQLNCLSYADAQGNPTADYPQNPNGSELNCAGLTNPSGQVFGLMPHPEAYLSLYNHPNWGQMKRQNPDIAEEGEGLRLFKNIIRKLK